MRLGSSRWVVLAAAVVVAAVGGVQAGPWAEASTSTGDRAIFEPLPPARILDTRPSNPVGPGESRVLQVTGAGGVPADATAVVLNVTAFAPTAAGWLTLYPADATPPLASNVNFTAGQTVANLVQVKLGTGAAAGQIKIFNVTGQTHVIIDVGGYYRGHDHDDRYYTKAQAQARTAANSLTCPAGQFLNTVAADGTPTCGQIPSNSSGKWGVISRNTIGSPDIDLRGGPFVTTTPVSAGSPPLGTGSLKLLVNAGPPIEKASYGNEVDFVGQPVAGLTRVGFQVFTTGENSASGNPNMPGITFEIDPNLGATPSNFSSLVFSPSANSPANQWSGYIDATTAAGTWNLTGAAGTATGCTLATPCSFAQVQTALNDGGEAATILTAAVTKGRDFAWQGAVDGLRINATVYDFEENGVTGITVT